MLLHFPLDTDGFFWHHRVLIRRVRDAIWILLTPDGDLEVVDLATRRHIVLSRSAQPLRDCIKKLTEKVYDDWHFTEGPRLCREYLQSVDTAGGFVAFEAEWLRSSGVHPSFSAAHEHRTGSETLRLLVEVDLLNVPNLAGVENLCRRQVQVEIAVERNPAHPDFLGLNEIMSSPTTDSGAALTRKFRSWMGQQQKDRAKLLQQARLEREETNPEKTGRKRGKADRKGKDKDEPKGGKAVPPQG